MSQLKKMRKGQSRRALQQRMYEQLIFGKEQAPDAECARERQALLKRIGQQGKEFNAKNPAHFWAFLLGRFDKYNADRDGPSVAMKLVADVTAFREVEKEMRDECNRIQGDEDSVGLREDSRQTDS